MGFYIVPSSRPFFTTRRTWGGCPNTLDCDVRLSVLIRVRIFIVALVV